MNTTTKTRIMIDICLFGAIFLVPWWVIAFVTLLLLFKYEHFYEVLFVGLIIDAVYGVPVAALYNLPLVATMIAIIFFVAILYLKRLLIINR